jgi:hypothetical protein
LISAQDHAFGAEVLQAGAFSTDNITTSIALSVVLTAARAGFKAVIENIAGMSGSYTIQK